MIKLPFLVPFTGRSQRHQGRDAYSLLNRYDDHMLKDIGLSRRDVEGLRRGR